MRRISLCLFRFFFLLGGKLVLGLLQHLFVVLGGDGALIELRPEIRPRAMVRL